MKLLKRCPFCHQVVWFWQSKAYLDAKRKDPCHAICWWVDMSRMLTGDIRDFKLVVLLKDDEECLPLNPGVSVDRYLSIKVKDDSWRKGKGIEK